VVVRSVYPLLAHMMTHTITASTEHVCEPSRGPRFRGCNGSHCMRMMMMMMMMMIDVTRAVPVVHVLCLL
jgi:hypothetical protein